MLNKHPELTSLILAGFGLLSSCSSSDEAPFGGRIGSPMKTDIKRSSNPAAAASSPQGSPPEAVHPGPPYPSSREGWQPAAPYPKPDGYAGQWPPRPSEWWGLKLTPLEKVIADTCPEQVWSQYAPDIDCTKDEQCNDGFCDRGHCNAIWTCALRAGQRCENDRQCDGLCIDGRCRSCVSDEECEKKYGGLKGYVCGPPVKQPPFHRMCGMLAPNHH